MNNLDQLREPKDNSRTRTVEQITADVMKRPLLHGRHRVPPSPEDLLFSWNTFRTSDWKDYNLRVLGKHFFHTQTGIGRCSSRGDIGPQPFQSTRG